MSSLTFVPACNCVCVKLSLYLNAEHGLCDADGVKTCIKNAGTTMCGALKTDKSKPEENIKATKEWVH